MPFHSPIQNAAGWRAMAGFLAYTEDGGASWVERPLGIDRAINDIYFSGKERGFALAGGSIFGNLGRRSYVARGP